MVGVERFELPTSCSQSRRATRLRYTPFCLANFALQPEEVRILQPSFFQVNHFAKHFLSLINNDAPITSAQKLSTQYQHTSSAR